MDKKMMLKIAVCDDNSLDRHKVYEYIKKYKYKCLVDFFCNGEELIQKDKPYDIIFLDVEMPGLNGMETAAILRKKRRRDAIVFLTAYEEFMPAAFEVNAFRYLLKPISEIQFQKTYKDAEKDILHNKKIIIPLANTTGTECVFLNDICFVQSLGDQSCVYTGKSEIISNESLKKWERTLDSNQFYRISKEYIIAMNHIRRIEGTLVFFDVRSETVKIPRRGKRTLFERWQEYIRHNAFLR